MSLNKNEKKMEEVNSDVTNKSMVEDFTSFSIQNALQTLLEIVHGDIFGPAAEQREVECKAFLTFYYIGLMIHKEELDEVTYFIKQQIKNMKKFEIVMQMDRLLREFEKGLKLNKFIQKSDLFDWSIDVAEAHFYIPTIEDVVVVPKMKLASENARERIMCLPREGVLDRLNNGVVDKKQHYHIIVEFALKLMYNSMQIKCSKSKNERTLGLSIKMLRHVLKRQGTIKQAYGLGVRIVKTLQQTDGELYSQSLLLMTDIIRHCEDTFKQQDLQTILGVVKSNLKKEGKQDANFLFVFSLLKKGVVHANLYDLIFDYAKMLIQSKSLKLRKEAKELIVIFLTKYPLSEGQHKQYLEFFVKNIDYKEVDARISIASLLELVIGKMNSKQLEKSVNFLYVPVLRIASIEQSKAQPKLESLLQTLINKISKKTFSQIIDMNTNWIQNQQVGIRLIGFYAFVICSSKLDTKRINTLVNVVLETYQNESVDVQTQIIRLMNTIQPTNITFMNLILKTPVLNGVASYVERNISNCQDCNEPLLIAVNQVIEERNVIEWTKVIKNIINKNAELFTILMNTIGISANISIIKMLASLIDMIQTTTNGMELLVKYIFTQCKNKDKDIRTISNEVLEYCKQQMSTSTYYNIIKYD
ncbi:U3 small nucleolar RNA-associated protein 20 C-terminal domain-containing protein [Entamoeba marina]